MPVADVIREQAPFLRAARFDDEHRLGTYDNDGDEWRIVEEEAVSAAQYRAAGNRRAELDATISPASSVHVCAIFPAECDRVASVAARRVRQLGLGVDAIHDGHGLQNKKY